MVCANLSTILNGSINILPTNEKQTQLFFTSSPYCFDIEHRGILSLCVHMNTLNFLSLSTDTIILFDGIVVFDNAVDNITMKLYIFDEDNLVVDNTLSHDIIPSSKNVDFSLPDNNQTYGNFFLRKGNQAIVSFYINSYYLLSKMSQFYFYVLQG
ncbi:MAG: hypothetical protein QW478_01970 [Candidatus Micrarchaeaceae archaeon]